MKTKKDKALKRLVRVAKKAMKSLEWAMPCSPMGDLWAELYQAVKYAKKVK